MLRKELPVITAVVIEPSTVEATTLPATVRGAMSPYPTVAETWGPLLYVGSPLGAADYTAFQFTLVKRMSRGLAANMSYTWARAHGSIENAVAAMKAGAHDYVMKDNLARLGPAVERELHEAEARQARRRAEEALQYWRPDQIWLNPDCGFGCFANRCVNEEEHAVAMIDGNLGYIESRRGNFPAAFSWYAQARSRFEDLGETELNQPEAECEPDRLAGAGSRATTAAGEEAAPWSGVSR